MDSGKGNNNVLNGVTIDWKEDEFAEKRLQLLEYVTKD